MINWHMRTHLVFGSDFSPRKRPRGHLIDYNNLLRKPASSASKPLWNFILSKHHQKSYMTIYIFIYIIYIYDELYIYIESKNRQTTYHINPYIKPYIKASIAAALPGARLATCGTLPDESERQSNTWPYEAAGRWDHLPRKPVCLSSKSTLGVQLRLLLWGFQVIVTPEVRIWGPLNNGYKSI